ncbi:MAG: hypothetical protein GC186_09900 [Rhodobacteraceae bacterium]|nr:hypothetical protein [Paracoccaceae bacterium]
MVRPGALCLLAALAGPGLARADGIVGPDRYVGVILGSDHIGSAHLNNVNPGLTYGRIWPTARPGVNYFVEGGVFYNSYREISPLLVAGVAVDVGSIGPVRFRVGVEAGTAYYKTLAGELKRDYGIPNLGGFIPIVGLSLSAQVRQTEFRLTTVPAGRNVKAIINLSVAQHF